MRRADTNRIRIAVAAIGVFGLTACMPLGPDGLGSSSAPVRQPSGGNDSEEPLRLLNRLSWGASVESARQIAAIGDERFLEQQLHPESASLPREIQAQIDSMTISRRSLQELVFELEQQRKEIDTISDPERKKTARQSYQRELNRIAREAATRSLLRALYSPNQLQEQMTWFWMNHFNVFQYKGNIRGLIGDYEERAIHAHALGRFRDLLAATVHHPAMLHYLDNERNAAGHINENYARELMELHTLGINGGYSQRDVQELARILTGLGVNASPNTPRVRHELIDQYVREGLFEFNPNRHDYGDKVFLGQIVKGRGLGEVDEAIERLARHPATASFISRKLAAYFVTDDPSPPLIDRMARTFQATDGDIAATLRILFTSPDLLHSREHKFKDPVHYVLSAVRLAYDDKPILNAGPMLNWLNRMGEPLYGRATPDGYPMNQDAWASPGQMVTRFEIAKTIGYGSAGLFRTDDPQPSERPAFPQLANALYFGALQDGLSPTTRLALEQANSPQEWNMYLLASPEFMHR